MVARKSPAAAPAKRAAPAKSTPPTKKPAKAKAAVVARKATPTTETALPSPDVKVKHKLVRDSFTIPKAEYAVLQDLKSRAGGLMRPTKKSELLRAGIAALATLGDTAFLTALSKVQSLKTGRPKDPTRSA